MSKPVQLPLSVRLADHATFSNYYPGINAVALGYVERLCDLKVGWVESLIYLWGDKGVGCSHLLQAACLSFQQATKQAIYLPLNELITHPPAILENMESYDLVCLDDLQVIEGNNQWQEAIFHLFNRLIDSNKRLLIAANNAPTGLPIELIDLVSRLSHSLIFQLHSLSDEDKLRALQLRASRRGIQLTEEVGMFILNRGERDMASLFQLLELLDKASLAAKHKITIPFVKQVLNW